MLTIKVMLDFLHSPIWTYEDGIVVNDPEIIENDTTLQEWCSQAMEMYSSYYEFNSHDMPCWFNSEKEHAEKLQMLSLIRKIIKRLAEINDGSFIVEDYETSRLNAL